MKRKIVIKLGGSALSDPKTLRELVMAVTGYRKKNDDVILVHGGGPAINRELTAKGIQWRFVDGQRQTTPEMIDVIEDVLAGQVNGAIVNALKAEGIPAQGLSGARDRILKCTQASEELMLVGRVEYVDTTALDAALAMGLVPVVAPIGFGDGEAKYNINADWAASKIATAVGANQLVFLTDQSGILDGERNLVRMATPPLIQKMIVEGVISGGMCTKVLAMISALDAGIEKVRVLHAAFASQIHGRIKIGTVLSKKLLLNRNKRENLHEHAS